MKCGIVVFPGSNCDHDCYHILKHILNQETHWLWHKEEANLESFDLVVLPGGFSYGDYLRAGAIARFSPIMNSIIHFAKKGGKVLGICNGFQILLECGLLPGVLIQNQSRKFICKNVFVCIDNPDTAFTQDCGEKNVLEIPMPVERANMAGASPLSTPRVRNSLPLVDSLVTPAIPRMVINAPNPTAIMR